MDKIRLLLVDDHAVVRAGYRQLISTSDKIEVVGESETGEEGCQLYFQLNPDVLVIDLSLPRMSGLEAIRRIKQRDPAAAMLAFTMHSEQVYLKRTLEAGAKGYLTKSCDPDLLLEGICVLAEGRRFIDPLFSNISKGLAGDESGGKSDLNELSPREFDIYRLLIDGQVNREIAESLSLSQKTVANYATQIKAKLGVKTIAEMTRKALLFGEP
jgi:DNA-binding NarL/FixJ family response regulator